MMDREVLRIITARGAGDAPLKTAAPSILDLLVSPI